MYRLSLRSNRLKLETSGESPISLEESILEYTQMNGSIKTGRCQHVNRLDSQLLGSQPTMPKNFPGTGVTDM